MKRFIMLVVALALMLAACGYTEDDLAAAQSKGYKAGYADGHEDGYEEGYEKGFAALRPVDKPKSGTILEGREYDGSEITINADSDSDVVVTLKGLNGKTYVSFYVRAGDSVTVGVPDRILCVYFAYGNVWYGYGKGLMFGGDTHYSKDDEALDFSEATWEYTLYPVTDGNFSETPSNEEDFF